MFHHANNNNTSNANSALNRINNITTSARGIKRTIETRRSFENLKQQQPHQYSNRSALTDRTNSLEKEQCQKSKLVQEQQQHHQSIKNSSQNTKTISNTTTQKQRNGINDALKIAKAKSNARLKGMSTATSRSSRMPASTFSTTTTTITTTNSTRFPSEIQKNNINLSTHNDTAKTTGSVIRGSKNTNENSIPKNHHPITEHPQNATVFKFQGTNNDSTNTTNTTTSTTGSKLTKIHQNSNKNKTTTRRNTTQKDCTKESPEKKRKHSLEEEKDGDTLMYLIERQPSMSTNHPVIYHPKPVIPVTEPPKVVRKYKNIQTTGYSRDVVNGDDGHQLRRSSRRRSMIHNSVNNNTDVNNSNNDVNSNNTNTNHILQNIHDIQQARENASKVSEYEQEIFEYMQELDLQTMVDPNYMTMNQAKLDWNMRRILIDWLIQVHRRFSLLPETIFLAVNMMDRFLDSKEVSVEKFQLLGITCLFVACKYEEEHCPTVSDLVYMVDNTYTPDEIVAAERFVLGQLKYKIGYPGPLNFMRRISKADGYESKIRTLCKYFVEVTMMDERFLVFSCSKIAAAGMYLARRILYEKEWSQEHIRLSGYHEHEIIDCARWMLQVVENPSQHQAIFEKYQDLKYLGASTYMQEYLAHIKLIYH